MLWIAPVLTEHMVLLQIVRHKIAALAKMLVMSYEHETTRVWGERHGWAKHHESLHAGLSGEHPLNVLLANDMVDNFMDGAKRCYEVLQPLLPPLLLKG